MSQSPSRNEETRRNHETLETPEIPSTLGSIYQRYMRSLAERGLPTDPYLPPVTESDEEIQQHYEHNMGYARQILNGEGSSNMVMGVPTTHTFGSNPSEARFIQDMDQALLVQREAMETQHKHILWAADQIDMLWFQASKEKKARERLQLEMKLMWCLVILMTIVLANLLYHQME
jgi:hypothetical protein